METDVSDATILPNRAADDSAKGRDVCRPIRHEGGVAAIEYGLAASLIAVAAIAAFSSVGANISNVFNTIASNL
jgi:pilus assembly protein Flp/PilA